MTICTPVAPAEVQEVQVPEKVIEESWWVRVWRGSTPTAAAMAQSALLKRFVKKVPFWERMVPVQLPRYGTQYLATSKFGEGGGADSIPLVMTHGFGSGSGMFYRNFEELACKIGAPVFAVDWLGMGRSSRPEFPSRSAWSTEPLTQVDPAQISFFLDALETWRSDQGLEKINLLGHSWGGYLSTLYAERYPSRVNKLILVSPFGVPEPPAPMSAEKVPPLSWAMWAVTKFHQYNFTPHSMLHMFGPWGAGFIQKAVARRFKSKLEEEEKDLVAAYLFHVNAPEISGGLSLSAFSRFVVDTEEPRGLYAREPVQKQLACTKTPTTIVYGDQDWMMLMTPQVKDVVKLNPKHLKFRVLPNAGHHLYIDSAPEFNQLVVDTLLGKTDSYAEADLAEEDVQVEVQ